MGLDMYLLANKYVSGWDHNSQDRKDEYARVLAAIGLTPDDATADTPSIDVTVRVMYWRKANAIHGWFVREVQGGKDECQESDVSRQELETLLALCEECIAHPKKAKELLPPTAGFFFGSDDYYMDDLKNTVAGLKRVLANEKLKGFDFAYRASW